MRKLPNQRWLLIGALVFQALCTLILLSVVVQVSSISALVNTTAIRPVFLLYKRVEKMTDVFYRGPSPKEELPLYRLSIDPKGLRDIEEMLPTKPLSGYYGATVTLDREKLSWTKANFEADGEEYKVKIRVRGDLAPHWSEEKKSWRIKFRGDKLHRGMKQVNLILPEDRYYFGEPLNSFRAKYFGLVQPPMRFVRVSINGSKPMLYLEIEHWSKEMLEKQSLPGDVNFYKIGQGASSFSYWNPTSHASYLDTYEQRPYQENLSYEEMDLLLQYVRSGQYDDEYEKLFFSLFEREKVLNWYTQNILAGMVHAGDDNLRLFFDTTTGRLEPIPWDLHIYPSISLLSEPLDPFLLGVRRRPYLYRDVLRTLWDYVSDEERVEAEKEFMKKTRRNIERVAYRDSYKIHSNRFVHKQMDSVESMVKASLDDYESQLKTSEVLVEQRLPAKGSDQLLTIDLIANGVSPAILTELHVPEGIDTRSWTLLRDDGDGVPSPEDQSIELRVRPDPSGAGDTVLRVWEGSETGALVWPGATEVRSRWDLDPAHTTHRFFVVDRSGVREGLESPLKLELRNAITMKKVDPIGSALIDEKTFDRLSDRTISVEEFLAREPSFYRTEDGVGLRSATITESVIVPETAGRLTIAPGSTVRLGSGISLFSYVPVTVEGTSSSPIQFEPLGLKSWGVFAVIGAEGQSFVEYAEFRQGSQEFLNGTFITGMVAFHDSPVRVRDSIFRDAHGDDGLNVKYVPADIQNSQFIENHFDGLDVDIAQSGELSSLYFLENGNDGLDLSWSHIDVRDVVIQGSGDKCISVGERSNITIRNTAVSSCPFGIAVKDGSKVSSTGLTFDTHETAIAAYIKKPIFEAPEGTFAESTFTNVDSQVMMLSGAIVTIE